MRTILATIGLTLATVVAVVFVIHVQRVLVWMLIAVVFAVALYPAVDWLEHHVAWCGRALATLVVFLVVVLAFGGVLALFAIRLAEQGTQLATQLPGPHHPHRQTHPAAHRRRPAQASDLVNALTRLTALPQPIT